MNTLQKPPIQATVCREIWDYFYRYLWFCGRGEQHEGSDLDVFVELKEPDPFVMFDIKEELEHICNCKIDLLRLRKNLRSLISQRIEKDGIYA